jgi:hypothetical protein
LSIALFVAVFPCEASAFFERALGAPAPEDSFVLAFLSGERFGRVGDFNESQCFITGKTLEEPLEKTGETVFNRRQIPAFLEVSLCLSKTSAFRRFLREKGGEAVVVDEKFPVVADVSFNVFPKIEVNSPLIPLFSIQVAVRK